MTDRLVAPQIEEIIPQPKQVLLMNSPAVDLRLPWARWHQPTGLLQIGTALEKRGCDVRLLDCLRPNQGKRITRRQVGTIQVEDFELHLWHFGVSWGYITNTLRAFKAEGWVPDLVFVSCFVTSWWQGTQELILRLKEEWLPGVPVVLGGVYPTLEPEHAASHTQADLIVVGSLPEARAEIPRHDLLGAQRMPRFAGVYLYQSQSVSDVGVEDDVILRPPNEVAEEIAYKAKLGVNEFAVFDEEIRLDHRDHFLEVLEEITKRDLRVRFVAVGNISPYMIDNTVARKMGESGYRQVHLKCHATHRPGRVAYVTPYEVYEACAAALQTEAGFKPRTDQLTAMLLVGIPYENIESITERLIRLASIVGSVNLVPYQYTPGTAEGRMYEYLISRDNGHLNLTTLNCKLYPLARRTGIPYEHYVELTRLAALLNAKFRSTTFDFLGDRLVARAVQSSLRERAWDPFRTEGPVDHSEVIGLSQTPAREEEQR